MPSVRILAVTEGKEPWLKTAVELYNNKIKHFCGFEFIAIKPNKEARANSEQKKEKESEEILKKISEKDYVILCDERGKSFSSLSWAGDLSKKMETFSGRRFVFIIGGAYGSSEELVARAQEKIKLSDFTLNHHVALTLLLEQVYRAFTIQKGIPYHNE